MTTCHQNGIVEDGDGRPERVEESPEYGYNSINNSSVSQVFGESIQERISLALNKINSDSCRYNIQVYIAQFWSHKVIGKRCCLTTLDQPFVVGGLDETLRWYRMKCENHCYIIDNGAEEEQVGPPGRVFRNGHPESTPDLRLYSNKQFPLRDDAECCGYREYLALPVLDQNQCLGVLEFLCCNSMLWIDHFQFFQEALKEAQLRSTHDNFHPIDRFTENLKYKEIREMLELAIEVLPQLHLAQVWVPCNQCTNPISNHSSCMERLSFINAVDGKVNLLHVYDPSILEFLNAGKFHNVQAGKGIAGIVFSSLNKLCFCRNLSDFSIIDYPLAHYAQKASLSFGFSVCLQRVDNANDLYVFEFYLHSHIRDDTHTWSLLHLLLKIMKKKLKGFKVASGRELGDEMIVEVCKKNMLTSEQELPNSSRLGYEIIQHCQAKKNQCLEEFTIVMPMERCQERYSITDFKAFLQEADLSCLEEPSKHKYGWLFCSSKVSLESEVNDNSLLQPNQIQEKIRTLFRAVKSIWDEEAYCLVQFWAPKMVKDKFCLLTSDQPFALSFLCRGFCSYRKQCRKHHYFVGKGAKEEELGPPGRVFQSGRPESSPDIRLYSIKELPLRDHAAHCGLRRYLALPVFDSNQMQCVGILEFVEYGGDYDCDGLKNIKSAFEEANLISTPSCFWSSIQETSYLQRRNNDEGWKQALGEINEMLLSLNETPELRLAQVWVPCIHCAEKSNDLRCMECAAYECDHSLIFCEFADVCYSHQVQIGKGVAGMALGSENGSCFCRNLCDFSITKQPLAHYAQRARLDICFAICLQSSYTSNAPYVLEFFLNSAITRGQYSQSLLVLLKIMKQELKSFKVASGQQLGDELVVDVIESGREKQLSQSTYPDCLPIRFNIIQYSQEMENENSRNNQVHSDHNGMIDGMNISDAEQSDIAAANANKEVTTNKTKRSRKETSFHINRADLEPHFGKRLADVAREFGVGKSTLKRACRRYGIERWPSKEQNKRNPSLYLKENAANLFQDRDAEASISSGTNNPPLDLTAHQNKPHTNTESTRQLAKISLPETDMMMVKAKFKDDTMKFQIRISSGMEKLAEEVGKRLKLNIESLKLKYLDEGDDEWILLACEDDFQLCVKTSTALDKTCIQVLVELINN